MDFVNGWKAASILLTGAFGILGLLKEFKDKETGRITKWGGVSLVGILLSSILGVAAQLQTSWAEETQRSIAAQKTLTLVQNTDQSVKALQRILTPFTEPTFGFKFVASCNNPKFRSICRADRGKFNVEDLTEWPRQNPGELHLVVYVFLDERDVDALRYGNPYFLT